MMSTCGTTPLTCHFISNCLDDNDNVCVCVCVLARSVEANSNARNSVQLPTLYSSYLSCSTPSYNPQPAQSRHKKKSSGTQPIPSYLPNSAPSSCPHPALSRPTNARNSPQHHKLLLSCANNKSGVWRGRRPVLYG